MPDVEQNCGVSITPTPSAAATGSASTVSPSSGGACVIVATPSATSTGVSPTPVLKTQRPFAGMRPVRAHSSVAPTVGCPASGSSYPGVKIRSRRASSKHEDRLGDRQLARDRLHLLAGQPVAGRDDRELVTGERTVREDVEPCDPPHDLTTRVLAAWSCRARFSSSQVGQR